MRRSAAGLARRNRLDGKLDKDRLLTVTGLSDAFEHWSHGIQRGRTHIAGRVGDHSEARWISFCVQTTRKRWRRSKQPGNLCAELHVRFRDTA